MARLARKASSTDYYHVMIRGINKESVFSLKQHKRVFLKYIDQEQERNEISVLSWCIMNNHAHFVIKSELHNISKFIKIILLRFAYYYNKFNDRVGPVFGDRFRSEVIEDDNSLKQVVRYIHRNPVKAGMIDNIKDYRFSSYLEFINDASIIDHELRNFYLEYFKGNIKRYIKFHQEDQIADYFIDVKEERDRNQEEKLWRIVSEVNKKYSIEDFKEYKYRKEAFKDLVITTYENTDFSMMKLSELLGVSVNRVKYMLKYRNINKTKHKLIQKEPSPKAQLME